MCLHPTLASTAGCFVGPAVILLPNVPCNQSSACAAFFFASLLLALLPWGLVGSRPGLSPRLKHNMELQQQHATEGMGIERLILVVPHMLYIHAMQHTSKATSGP